MKKKSGAAQRLVSLVLALGLIFTLAPASVFAGDEVPVSSTVTAIADEEAVVDTTEPVVDNTEPVVDNTEPVVDNTEPAADGTEPAVDGTEPVVDGTEPVVDGTEPAVKVEPAQQKTLAKASAPAVMSQSPSLLGSEECTYKIVDSVLPVYAVEKRDALDKGNWIDSGEPITEYTRWMATLSDQIYFLVSVPENQEINVSYYEDGTLDPNGQVYEIKDGNIPLANEALEKGLTHYFVFSGPNYDDIDITVSFVQNDAYFYLHRYDAAADEVEATDFYYIGKGKVDLSTAAKGITITEGVDSHIAAGPDGYNDIVLNDDVNQRYPGLMTYTYSANGGAGTYSVAKWDMIKGENGATEAYPSGVELVESGTPTWHVDGTVSLNKPEAVFYAQVEGDTTAVYEMGSGYVTFRAAQPNDKVDLTQIIPDKALEKDFLTVPTSFPKIEYNGHNYTYTAQDEGKAFTYTVKGWNEAVGVSGEDGGTTEWRVNGEIKLNTPPEFTNEMKPNVGATPVTYDGQAHGLTIDYKKL